MTNHFLLILIRKGTIKSIEKAGNTVYSDLLVNYDLDWDKLKMIGEHRSFEWNRPEHMEPTNKILLSDVKILLDQKIYIMIYIDLPKIIYTHHRFVKHTFSIRNLIH